MSTNKTNNNTNNRYNDDLAVALFHLSSSNRQEVEISTPTWSNSDSTFSNFGRVRRNVGGVDAARSAILYLEKELNEVKTLAEEENKGMEYANYCNSLLDKEKHSVSEMDKLLFDIASDESAGDAVKEDAYKLFAEFCLVLNSAAENAEEEKKNKLSDDYMELFKKCEAKRNEIEFKNAKALGFTGTLKEFLESIS